MNKATDDWLDLVLEPAESTDVLVPIDRRQLGGTTVARKDVSIRLGATPLVTSLSRETATALVDGNARPLLLDVYDIWRVDFHIQVTAEAARRVRSVGAEVRFAADVPVTILGVLPRTDLIKRGNAGLVVEAQADIKGSAGMAADLESHPISELIPATAALHAAGHITWDIKYQVLSPRIVANGDGDDQASWQLYQGDGSLLGIHRLTAFVVMPEGTQKLSAQGFVTGRVSGVFGIPLRLSSKSADLVLAPMFVGLGTNATTA
jgi:hypothetical protein